MRRRSASSQRPMAAASTRRPRSSHGLLKLSTLTRPRAQRVDLNERADARELGVALNANGNALAAELLDARHAPDEARVRRRSHREREGMGPAHEPLARGAALHDGRRARPDANRLHATRDGTPG